MTTKTGKCQTPNTKYQIPNTKHQTLILRLLYRIEDAILVSLLLLMITMAVAQIFLRNFFESGIVWGDILVRILVLWVGLFGAMVASRQNKHISIDIVTRYLSEKVTYWVNIITALFTSVICSIIAWHSFRFVQMEFEDGGKVFAQVPVWICEVVIPFAFTVIALRYFILAFSNFNIFHNKPRNTQNIRKY